MNHTLALLSALLLALAALRSSATDKPTVPSACIDIRSFGAIGDGVADDTDALQKALTGGQRAVLIPPGTYQIRAALKVDSGTTIQAAPNAIIRLADGAGTNAGVFLLTNRDPAGGDTNITVEGGVWDGNNELSAQNS